MVCGNLAMAIQGAGRPAFVTNHVELILLLFPVISMVCHRPPVFPAEAGIQRAGYRADDEVMLKRYWFETT